MTTAIKAAPMTVFQAHIDLGEAHSLLFGLDGMTVEGYEVIIRAMAHIRAQMSVLSLVIFGVGQ